MKFYRFQGRETLDSHSYCEFLVDIWFELGGSDKEANWDELDEEIQSELLEELDEKWGMVADIWLDYYKKSLNPLLPRVEDSPLETIIYLVDSCIDLNDLVELQLKFPLPGVFAIEEDSQSLEHLFRCSKSWNLGLHNNFLLILESDDWMDLEDYGCLLFDAKCLNVVPVPEEFHKPPYTEEDLSLITN